MLRKTIFGLIAIAGLLTVSSGTASAYYRYRGHGPGWGYRNYYRGGYGVSVVTPPVYTTPVYGYPAVGPYGYGAAPYGYYGQPGLGVSTPGFGFYVR